MTLSIPTEQLLNRETDFERFITETLDPFWQQRHEWSFSGVDGITIQCLRFTNPNHHKVVVIVSGFLESYIKYQELIYDFFQQGYDVFMMDNRGQGFSGRMLKKTTAVYVERFSDYVDDLATFWHDNIENSHYQQRYIFGHSMGGAITALLLAREPNIANAVVLSAPMIGIKLPMPLWCANALINISQRCDYFKKSFVFKRKTPLPFKLSISSQSEARYQRFVDLYYQYPATQLHGPTYHWVKEAMAAGNEIIKLASGIKTPLLLLQAGNERLVSNTAQEQFITALEQAGNHHSGGGLTRYPSAAHEILFDHDSIRLAALNQVLYFFAQYQNPSYQE